MNCLSNLELKLFDKHKLPVEPETEMFLQTQIVCGFIFNMIGNMEIITLT